MTAVTKLEAEMEMFPILRYHISGRLLEDGNTFTTEVPLPFDEKHSSIFFSKYYCSGGDNFNHLYFYDKEGKLLLNCENNKNVEQNIIELLVNKRKVTQIIREKINLLQLYVVPEGCDSVADIMIPLLVKERQKARNSLQKKIAELYPKKEETDCYMKTGWRAFG
jgi:hypothetical protein